MVWPISRESYRQAFNDQHEHEVGDLVLRGAAQVLQSQTRGSDVAARFGGEAFTIVLADITDQLAFERAERARRAVEGLVPRASGKEVGSVTISIGLAQFPRSGRWWRPCSWRPTTHFMMPKAAVATVW